MPTGIELRPIFFAQQYRGVLWDIISLLKKFEPESLEQLKSLSLCYHRDGKIDICSNPCKNSLNDWNLMAFYNYVDAVDGKVFFSMGIDYEKIIQFVDTLINESPFDLDLIERFYIDPENIGCESDNFNNITDPFVKIKSQRDEWWEEYKKVRQEVSEVCYQIGSELNWTLRFQGLLKDKILESVFNLSYYMPERFHKYKKECRRTFRELYDKGGINALPDYEKRICKISEPFLRDFYSKRRDLFSEVQINDLLLYIVSINISFEFWTF